VGLHTGYSAPGTGLHTGYADPGAGLHTGYADPGTVLHTGYADPGTSLAHSCGCAREITGAGLLSGRAAIRSTSSRVHRLDCRVISVSMSQAFSYVESILIYPLVCM